LPPAAVAITAIVVVVVVVVVVVGGGGGGGFYYFRSAVGDVMIELLIYRCNTASPSIGCGDYTNYCMNRTAAGALKIVPITLFISSELDRVRHQDQFSLDLSNVNAPISILTAESGASPGLTSRYSNDSDEHESFNRLRQVAPIFTPSDARQLGLTRVCPTQTASQSVRLFCRAHGRD